MKGKRIKKVYDKATPEKECVAVAEVRGVFDKSGTLVSSFVAAARSLTQDRWGRFASRYFQQMLVRDDMGLTEVHRPGM